MARTVGIGIQNFEKMIKSNTARLVILAEDASENTEKAIKNACDYYGTEFIQCSNKADLGHFSGAKADRAVVCVNDNNFAKAILDIYKS